MAKLLQDAVATKKRLRQIVEAMDAPSLFKDTGSSEKASKKTKMAAFDDSNNEGEDNMKPNNESKKSKKKSLKNEALATTSHKDGDDLSSTIVEAVKEDQKENRHILKKTNKTTGEMSETILYVGHLPHGFYEKEMRKFFSQFGDVLRVKVFRSKKTNRSKGYAFVQFEEAEVAKVVSETVNGYMVSDKQLVCNIVPKTKIHDGMFKRPKRIPGIDYQIEEQAKE